MTRELNGLVAAKALRLRSKNSNSWSQDLLIDAMGNNGTIVLGDKNRGKHIEIGVDIRLSSTGLTKIVYFRPYFMLYNQTEVATETLMKGEQISNEC